jgi:hypothetical protein
MARGRFVVRTRLPCKSGVAGLADPALDEKELLVALSEEARRRFVSVIEQTDRSNTNPDDDAALLSFVAWALVHEPHALQERFPLESIMSEHGLTDNRMRYVMIILRAAAPLVAAHERERERSGENRPEGFAPPGTRPER